MTDRGQAHTLEGVVAALLLLSSLLFVLQVTTVTPLSASTSSQHIENQERAVGVGILKSASEQGDLKPALLYWNASARNFHNATVKDHYADAPPNDFGSLLNRSLSSRGIAYNIQIRYMTDENTTESRLLVDQGFPSDNAVTVSRTVVLTDDDRIYNESGTPSSVTLGELDFSTGNPFYAEDIDDGSPLFNVVTVEVTLWRI